MLPNIGNGNFNKFPNELCRNDTLQKLNKIFLFGTGFNSFHTLKI